MTTPPSTRHHAARAAIIGAGILVALVAGPAAATAASTTAGGAAVITVPGATVPGSETPVGTTPEPSTPEVAVHDVSIPEDWAPIVVGPELPAPDAKLPAAPTRQTEAPGATATPARTSAPTAPTTGAGKVDLDAGGNLSIDVDCGAMRCELMGGSVDLAGGLTLQLPEGAASDGSVRHNLKAWSQEYRQIQGELSRGGCIVVRYRVRVQTPVGDEVKTHDQSICGSKVTFSARRPVATAEKATRRIRTRAVCSQACELTPRFLLVKRGNVVLARATEVRVATTDPTGKVHTATWTLSRAQEAEIRRGARAGSDKIRYIVSARADTAGVATVGTASFRTRTHR